MLKSNDKIYNSGVIFNTVSSCANKCCYCSQSTVRFRMKLSEKEIMVVSQKKALPQFVLMENFFYRQIGTTNWEQSKHLSQGAIVRSEQELP